MYYDRLIVNVKKTAQSLPCILDIPVDIPQAGVDLITYPNNFTSNYIIAYGIEGQVPDVDADKVYDYHTAFDIKPTEVSYNVDINANGKAIRNIKLERDSNNSVATVGYVKEIIPFTKNSLYREYFEEYYDFSDATNYNLNIGVSGVVFTGTNPNLPFQSSKDLNFINTNGLRLQNNYFSVAIPNNPNFTICIVMKLMNRNFNIFFGTFSFPLKVLSFNKVSKELTLLTTSTSTKFTIPSLFNGKKLFYGWQKIEVQML